MMHRPMNVKFTFHLYHLFKRRETAAPTTVPPPSICLLWNCRSIERVHSWDVQAVKNVKIKTVYYQATAERQQPNILTSNLEDVSLLRCKTGAQLRGFQPCGSP